MRIRLRSWVVFQCQGHEGSKVSFESLWLFTADCQLLSVTVSVYRALCHVVNATRLIQNFSHNSWLSTAPCWILVEENMLQMKLKHNFTLRRFARVRMRLKHPVTLLTVSCFYRTHQGKIYSLMEKYFSWAITKMFRNNIFITILFPRQLTCNRNARNARLLWKTNRTHCTHLIEGQVKIRSMHCKSNCNENHHIYIMHHYLFQRIHLN